MFRKPITLSLSTISLTIAAILMLCTSCLNSDWTESQTSLSATDTDGALLEQVTVPATNIDGTTVTKQVTIVSNRSWSAVVKPDSDWVTVSQLEDLNLSFSTEKTPLTLSFNDFFDQTSVREATLEITTETETISLLITQSALVPELRIANGNSFSLPEEGGDIQLDILCNVDWSAKVKDGSDSEITIDTPSGHRNSSVNVHVGLGTNISKESVSTLIISAEGCEDVEVTISQPMMTPELTVDLENTRTDILPGSGEYPISFYCKEDWTATLSGAHEGFRLTSTKGEGLDNKLSIIADDYDMCTVNNLETKTFTVTIQTPSGLQKDIDFTRRGHIIVPFKKYGDDLKVTGWGSTVQYTWYKSDTDFTTANTAAPRDDNGRQGTGFGAGGGTHTVYDKLGYQYTVYSGTDEDTYKGAFYVASNGLVLGDDRPDLTPAEPAFHISTPALEGRRLSQVLIMPGYSGSGNNGEVHATGLTSAITDLSGNIIAGGDLQTVEKYSPEASYYSVMTEDFNENSSSVFEFNLPQTRSNTSYRIAGTSRQTLRWIILYYEQAQ